MGDAADYAIWRRYGIDISDDGHFEKQRRFQGFDPAKASPAGPPDYQPKAEIIRPTKRNNSMNTNEVVTLMQLSNGATIFAGRYLQGDHRQRVYHFKDVLALGLDVGDIAVVQTRDTFSLIEVTDIRIPPHSIGCPVGDLKHVVQRVDMKPLDRIVKAESVAAHELAMSEVHERLQAFRDQLGGSYDRVAKLVSPQQDAEDDVIDEGDIQSTDKGDGY